MRLGFALLLSSLLFSVNTHTQQKLSLSDTPAGLQADAYLKAFNSGDTTVMKAYILQGFARRMLQDAPMSQRLERYKRFYGMTHGLTVQKVVALREDHIKMIVKAGDGKMLAMAFECESDAPHGITGITIDEDAGESTVEPVKSNSELVKKTGEYVAALAAAGDFSGVVMIAKNNEIVFQNAWGFADKDQTVPNSIETKFNIGSMDKSFTALAIHRLAAQGKLKLTDPIKTFLPDYPNKEAAEKVTVMQLLEMTSGIGDFFGERFMAAQKEKIKDIRDYLPFFADKPLEFEPGTRTRYSNGGYIVLGAIIERITGIDYYAFVKKEILIPAGMVNTDWFERTALPANCAVGYTYSTGTGKENLRHRNTELLPQRGSSAGGGYSNAIDLLRYTKALQSKSFAPESFDQRNGMGIAGGTAGVNAALEWNKQSGTVIIVLSNFDPPIAEKVMRQVRMLLGI